MDFIVIGKDGIDSEALNRRLSARQSHLEMLEKLKSEKKCLYATALLDDDAKMIGSMVVVDFNSREDLDAWLKVEPYVIGNVWQKIEVTPCRVAPGFKS